MLGNGGKQRRKVGRVPERASADGVKDASQVRV
jgi:hypothetical protein